MRGIPTPVINVPGCPPHPDWMVGTLALLLDAMKRKGTEGGVLEIMRGLDDVGRPKVFYPNTHLTCPYLSSFEDGIFSPFMTDKKGCRFELGCRGAVERLRLRHAEVERRGQLVHRQRHLRGLHVAQFSRRHVPLL